MSPERDAEPAPAWVLDVAKDTVTYRLMHLQEVMLGRDEDITDNDLWRLRRTQLDGVLARVMIPAGRPAPGSSGRPEDQGEARDGVL